MRQLSVALVLTAALALTADAGEPKAKPYDLLQVRSKKVEVGDAYLLAYASCYVFPRFLGVKDQSNNKEFLAKFDAKFTALGLSHVRLFADAYTGAEVVVMSNDKAVLVVFRGSEDGDCCAFVRDWLTNIDARLTKAPEMGKGARVHRGMYKALESVFDDLSKEVGKQGGFTDKRVYVTGHSLGGGMAQLCGSRLYHEGKGTPVVYTFGSPRVGNFDFRKGMGDVPVHRWVNKNDLIPMLPSDRVFDYRHVGLTHNITRKGELELDDKEWRGLGTRKEHHIFRYLWALHDNMPKELCERLPEPP